MKKFLAIAAVAALACSASAASLNWTATVIYEPGTETLANGYSIYLFLTAQSKTFVDGVTTTTVDDVKDLVENKNTSDFESLKAVSAEVNSGRAPSATGFNGNNFGAGDSLSGFAVILDGADLSSAQHYIITSVQSASWTSGTGAKSLGFGSQKNATWVAVPEPSVALMGLLGLGMMLKRRRA